MNKKQKIIVSIVGITIVLLALLGVTYAYYLTRIEGNTNTNSISITTADLKIEYRDGNGIISAENIMPGDTVGTKTFTITNTGNTVVKNYRVVLEYAAIEGMLPSVFKYPNDFEISLICVSKNNTTNEVSGTCNGYKGTWNNETFDMVINNIDAGIRHEFSLVIKYNDSGTDQSDDMGKNLNLKIQIYDELATSTLSGKVTGVYDSYVMQLNDNHKVSTLNKIGNTNDYRYYFTGVEPGEHILSLLREDGSIISSENITIEKGVSSNVVGNKITVSDSKSTVYISSNFSGTSLTSTATFNPFADNKNSLAYHILNNALTVTPDDNLLGKTLYRDIPITRPASEVSLNLEKILSITEDDYGTSYYYRGNVIDNYVNFAGMCWRILRINGDNSIKLILDDKNSECNSDLFIGNWSIGTGNYGYELKNVNNTPELEYIMNYQKPVDEKESSMIKAFYNFQTNKLSQYLNKLKSGDWCLNDKAYSRTENGENYIFTLLNQYNYSLYMRYDANTRLFRTNINGYQATLKCNGSFLNEFADVDNVSTKSPMYVGAIYADEIVFSGGKYDVTNYDYYIYNDYSKDRMSFWLLTPFCFTGDRDVAFRVLSNGSLLNYNVYNTGYNFRPVVNLLPNTIITSGDGTISNPYIIG